MFCSSVRFLVRQNNNNTLFRNSQIFLCSSSSSSSTIEGNDSSSTSDDSNDSKPTKNDSSENISEKNTSTTTLTQQNKVRLVTPDDIDFDEANEEYFLLQHSKPKRPLTSYALFNKLANFEDERVKEEENFEKRSKLVSSFWKQVPEKSKELFRQQVVEINQERLGVDTFLAVDAVVVSNIISSEEEEEELRGASRNDAVSSSARNFATVDNLEEEQQRRMELVRATREAVLKKCVNVTSLSIINGVGSAEDDDFFDTKKQRRLRRRRLREKEVMEETVKKLRENGAGDAKIKEEEEKFNSRWISSNERRRNRSTISTNTSSAASNGSNVSSSSPELAPSSGSQPPPSSLRSKPLSHRQRYFRRHYSDVINLPFHQRLAALHRMYEGQMLSERGQKASRKTLPLHDRTARLYAMFHGYNGNSFQKYAELEHLQDPQVMEKRVENLRRMYRQAVSSSVRKRGPPYVR